MRRTMSFSFSVMVVMALGAPAALGDDLDAKRAEGQKQVDAAKVKACEGSKKYLQAQAKTCGDEATEAKGLDCQSASKRMQDLMWSCADKFKAGAKVDAKAKPAETKPAETKAEGTKSADAKADAKTTCRAVDDAGATITELSDTDALACQKRIREEVKKLKCAAGTKKFKYQYVRAERKPLASTAYCD